jgi:hypothetical protein
MTRFVSFCTAYMLWNSTTYFLLDSMSSLTNFENDILNAYTNINLSTIWTWNVFKLPQLKWPFRWLFHVYMRVLWNCPFKIAELVGLVQDAVVKGRNLGLGTRRRRAFRQLLKANLSSTLLKLSKSGNPLDKGKSATAWQQEVRNPFENDKSSIPLDNGMPVTLLTTERQKPA